MQKIFLLIVVILISFYGCSKKTDGNTAPPSTMDCEAIDSRFAVSVQPIIQTNCAKAGCHATGSTNGPGKLNNFTEISNASAEIKSAVSSGRMPKGSSLSANDKNIILCWIAGGSPNN